MWCEAREGAEACHVTADSAFIPALPNFRITHPVTRLTHGVVGRLFAYTKRSAQGTW